MPRKSQDALNVVTGLPGQRQQPPSRLSAEAAEVWRGIVASKPHDWFTPDTCHLLEALCVAIVAHRAIAKQLDAGNRKLAEDDSLGRFDRLTRMHDRQVRVLTSIATKLRLTNQSRYTPKAANTAAKAKGTRPWDA
jgi:phage terminase small subunit